jgi:hypothetical protein
MPQPPIYLDDNGEPITAPLYLDDDGNEIGQPPPPTVTKAGKSARGREGLRLSDIPADSLPTDAAFLKRAPQVGAAIASAFTGGLAAIPMAALGGASGSLVKAQAEQGLHVPSAADVGDAAVEGAVQGGAQAAGAGLAKVAGPAGRWLYAKGLAPGKTLQRDFPVDELVDTAIREGINITGKGAKQAAAARNASAATAREIVENAAATGRQDLVRAAEVAGAFKAPREALRGAKSIGKDITGEQTALAARAKRVAESFGGKRAIPETPATPDRVVSRGTPAVADTADVADLARSPAPLSTLGPQADAVSRAREIGPLADVVPPRLLAGSPAPTRGGVEFVSPGTPAIPGTPARPGAISLVDAQARKEAAQDAAEKAYRARALGHQVSDIDAMTDEGLASAYRQAIEQRVPQVAAQNANTQSLIGLTRALDDAELRPHVLRWLMSMTQGSGLALATDPITGAASAATQYVLTSPRAMGGLGIVLGRLGQTSGQVPANLSRALISALDADEAIRENDDEMPEDVVPSLSPPEQTNAQPSRPRLPIRLREEAAAQPTPPKFPARLRDQAPAKQAGQLEPGNIDLNRRPVVKNGDGTISTVRSMSVNIDGREVLIPTVSDDGRVMSDDEAIEEFERTGRHLGVFDSTESATAFAEQLHTSQARKYGGLPPIRR